ncbi:hypothetical protein MCP_2163 [Methanocella paludicola SANAE]|uniref:DNA primase/polymerase bifunctional N-terminal domain-containing protein n=1 Tax=Methanocella paludicola (strain DSM 17711 / JCM 13418 / NBRC 101707 / SANAE) TaxID=304371 RepID=D1Z0L3_METPS|nr:bifunctional DNA primase/polymerase [Methanocella paludicola]BAI62235.1 hypothetical protein MCP_2163 [Methanocella paludicola SANAE]
MALPSKATIQLIRAEQDQTIANLRKMAINGYPCMVLSKEKKSPLIHKKIIDGNLNPLWATSNPDLIEALVKRFYPCNYGLYTLGKNIVVIDTDNKKIVLKNGKELFYGLTGVQAYYLLANQYPEILNTIKVKTPSGGIHYYFSVPEGYDISGFNAADAMSKPVKVPIIGSWFGMDVRSQKSQGIIVTPPSSKKGVKYEYIGERTLLNTHIDDLPVLPDFLLNILKSMGYARRSKHDN